MTKETMSSKRAYEFGKGVDDTMKRILETHRKPFLECFHEIRKNLGRDEYNRLMMEDQEND